MALNGELGGARVDYDGRIGWLARALEVLDVPNTVRGQTVVDLGANTGHWCGVYKGWGAKRVVGVEGRGEFLGALRERADGAIQADVREYSPCEQFTVVSALGLIYHLADPWAVLRRVCDAARALVLVVESQCWEHEWINRELPKDGTMALEAGAVPRLTRDLYVLGALKAGFRLFAECSRPAWGTQTMEADTGERVEILSQRVLWVMKP